MQRIIKNIGLLKTSFIMFPLLSSFMFPLPSKSATVTGDYMTLFSNVVYEYSFLNNQPLNRPRITLLDESNTSKTDSRTIQLDKTETLSVNLGANFEAFEISVDSEFSETISRPFTIPPKTRLQVFLDWRGDILTGGTLTRTNKIFGTSTQDLLDLGDGVISAFGAVTDDFTPIEHPDPDPDPDPDPTPVPEPLTSILGSVTALGIGAALKGVHIKQLEKAKLEVT